MYGKKKSQNGSRTALREESRKNTFLRRRRKIKEKRRMACTDTAKDVNNALHQCGDAAAKIITLQYAAYMN
jgi:hypothetical protein